MSEMNWQEGRDMAKLIEAHWHSLTSQGNIYSMSKLCSTHRSNKVLIASLKRKIYSCEYHRSGGCFLRALIKEQLFTYIPSGAEIISIDAYNKQDSGNELVIGVTIVKENDLSSVERYLNIYSEGAGDGDSDENSCVESIAQNCLTLELSYTPYHLYHTFLKNDESENEIVWLISGDDENIHMIREDKRSHGYSELTIDKYFPELADLRAVALKIDIHYYAEGKRRLTVVGCKCGLVKVSMIEVEKLEIMKSWMLRYDNPISTVNIFSKRNPVVRPIFVDTLASTLPKDRDKIDEEASFINILIVNALNGAAVVFMDVDRLGMTCDITLVGSESTNSIVTSCIADVNMDGQNEILLGTYDHRVNIFSYCDNSWILFNKIQFDAPIYSIGYIDLTGDGAKELVVFTQHGLHIMQHEPNEVNRRWKHQFKKFLSQKITGNVFRDKKIQLKSMEGLGTRSLINN